jgi:outer membrane protein assembly factor BamB
MPNREQATGPWRLASYLSPALQRIIVWSLAFGCGGRVPTPPVNDPAETAKVVWTFEQVERGAIISSPLVTGDYVYVAAIRDLGLSTAGAVYCLERDTGKRVWTFDNDGDMQHMYSSPCLADGRLYVGEGMHANHICKLYCLNAASGREVWHFVTAGHIESSPCVADGKVFFGSGDDGIYCLDAATGAKCWHFEGPYHVDSKTAVVGKRLYAGSIVSRTRKATEVFCLDTEDGTLQWHVPTDLPASGSPAVDGTDVFFGLGNGRLATSAQPPEKPAGALLCVDAASGRRRWQCAVGDAVHTRPAIDANRAYFGARDGYCYCVDRRGGQPCWSEEMGSPVVTTPALLDGYVYVVASGGRVGRLDADSGKTTWKFDVARYSRTKPRLFSSPTVIRDPSASGHRRIYLGAELQMAVNNAAVLYCLRD